MPLEYIFTIASASRTAVRWGLLRAVYTHHLTANAFCTNLYISETYMTEWRYYPELSDIADLRNRDYLTPGRIWPSWYDPWQRLTLSEKGKQTLTDAVMAGEQIYEFKRRG